MLANVCQHNVPRLPYEVVRLAEDVAGGLLATLPSLADLERPRLGPPLRVERMHGAGSPRARRVVGRPG